MLDPPDPLIFSLCLWFKYRGRLCVRVWTVGKCKKERKKRKTVVVSCFGDSATHFHLKDEGDRLLLLASAQVQTLKKDYEKQKVAGIKEICFGVKWKKKETRGLSISSFVNSWVLFDLIHWQAPKIVEWSQVRFFPPFQRSDNKNKSPTQYQRHSGRGRKERGEKYKKKKRNRKYIGKRRRGRVLPSGWADHYFLKLLRITFHLGQFEGFCLLEDWRARSVRVRK